MGQVKLSPIRAADPFWALLYIDKVYWREALNREQVVEFRYEIQPNRTANFSGFTFPGQ